MAAAAGCRQRAKQVWASQRACAVARSLAVHTVCDTHASRPSAAAFSARRRRTGRVRTRQRPRVAETVTLRLYIDPRGPQGASAALQVNLPAARHCRRRLCRCLHSTFPRCWPLCCN